MAELSELKTIELRTIAGNQTTETFIEDLNVNFGNIQDNANNNFNNIKEDIKTLNEQSAEALEKGEGANLRLDNLDGGIKERVSDAGTIDGWRYRKWIKTQNATTEEISYELWRRVYVKAKVTTNVALPKLDGLYSVDYVGGKSTQYYILTTPASTQESSTIAADITYSASGNREHKHYAQLFANYSGDAMVYIWIKAN